MQIIHHAISSHSSLDLTTADGDALHVLDLCGRNLGIDVPTKWISLWLPLVGDIEIDVEQDVRRAVEAVERVDREFHVALSSRCRAS